MYSQLDRTKQPGLSVMLPYEGHPGMLFHMNSYQPSGNMLSESIDNNEDEWNKRIKENYPAIHYENLLNQLSKLHGIAAAHLENINDLGIKTGNPFRPVQHFDREAHEQQQNLHATLAGISNSHDAVLSAAERAGHLESLAAHMPDEDIDRRYDIAGWKGGKHWDDGWLGIRTSIPEEERNARLKEDKTVRKLLETLEMLGAYNYIRENEDIHKYFKDDVKKLATRYHDMSLAHATLETQIRDIEVSKNSDRLLGPYDTSRPPSNKPEGYVRSPFPTHIFTETEIEPKTGKKYEFTRYAADIIPETQLYAMRDKAKENLANIKNRMIALDPSLADERDARVGCTTGKCGSFVSGDPFLKRIRTLANDELDQPHRIWRGDKWKFSPDHGSILHNPLLRWKTGEKSNLVVKGIANRGGTTVVSHFGDDNTLRDVVDALGGEVKTHRLEESIKKRGNKFIVTNKSGSKVLGTHRTEESAKKQLAAIEISKKMNEDSEFESYSTRRIKRRMRNDPSKFDQPTLNFAKQGDDLFLNKANEIISNGDNAIKLYLSPVGYDPDPTTMFPPRAKHPHEIQAFAYALANHPDYGPKHEMTKHVRSLLAKTLIDWGKRK